MKPKDKSFVNFDSYPNKPVQSDQQFKDFDATTLFCSHCKQAVPVRKKLLLALPDGDKYDYLCPYCGNSVGTKTETTKVSAPLILH